MKVIGYNLTKVLAEKKAEAKTINSINTSIEFVNIEKDKIDSIKDFEVIKVNFNFTVSYESQADKKDTILKIARIELEGNLIFAADKEESKELLKFSKKKDLPTNIKVPLNNVIFKKCLIRSLELADSLNLPFHIPIPQATLQQKQN
ncbi:MAG: hypothetical protein Q7R87_00010 [Nanoarchaeota archaeon]|nr:hypothetical protein [Nanoarchaeota archaeon]